MLVIIRGAGDIASGVINVLSQSGFKVLALETEKPTAIRKTVSYSECIYINEYTVENLKSKFCENEKEIEECWEENKIPIVIDPAGKMIEKYKPEVLIDAILAKKNLGTKKDLAPLTVALGPGFTAGEDVHIVIETNRGHNLGRIIDLGRAEENTGVPGIIKGVGSERVIYADVSGKFKSLKKIGDIVEKNEIIGFIEDNEVKATISGLLRGIIGDEFLVKKGLKIADIDPRIEEKNNCFTISDKARALGGATLTAIMKYLNGKESRYGNRYIK